MRFVPLDVALVAVGLAGLAVSVAVLAGWPWALMVVSLALIALGVSIP